MECNEALTPNGMIQGVREDGVLVFKNIPFARCARWQAPEKLELPKGEYRAVEYGPAPIQNPPDPFWAKRSGELIDFPQSEDCLNLNIWTADVNKPKKAVLFWVYGGSYI
ncbi:MAG: carboxylesterase family protein, partial [Clostridiales bacterium]|nr:carboxylesterase family protein [Clostridiales bacterium]